MNYEDFHKRAVHLPQFYLIDPRDMYRWFNGVMDIDPDRLEWHLGRLAAIGGSEIGVFVAEHLGLPTPFGVTSDDIFRAKLMMDVPKPPNEAMLFGIEHEDQVREAFEHQAKAMGWRRAVDALELFDQRAMQFQREDDLRYLGYSPDDLFYDESGCLVIVDYKVPYFKLPNPEDIPLGYASQLHQGRMVAQVLGYENPRMVLVYGLHPEAKIDNAPKHFKIMPLVINHDTEIESAILHTNETFFPKRILKGMEHIDITRVKTAQALDIFSEIADLMRKKSEIEAAIEAKKSDFIKLLASDISLQKSVKAELNEKNQGSFALSPKVQDMELFVQRIMDHGLDPEQFITRTLSKTLNTEKLVEALRDAYAKLNMPLDLNAFRDEIPRPDVQAALKAGVKLDDVNMDYVLSIRLPKNKEATSLPQIRLTP